MSKKKFIVCIIAFVICYFLLNGILLAATSKTGPEWIAYAINSFMK